jgi:hypothetical protein
MACDWACIPLRISFGYVFMYGVKHRYLHDASKRSCARLLPCMAEQAVYDHLLESQTALVSHLTILWA